MKPAARIELEGPARDAMARALATYLNDEHGLEIARMEAVLFVDFIAERLGPHFYNQALADARARLQTKFEALDETFYELEKTAKS
jgi:uncharacterized protein (DUF2164 family)